MILVLVLSLILGVESDTTFLRIKRKLSLHPFNDSLNLECASELYRINRKLEALDVLNGLLGWAEKKEVIWRADLLISRIHMELGNFSLSESYLEGLLADPSLPPEIRDEARLLKLMLKYRRGSPELRSPIDVNLLFAKLYPRSPKTPTLLHEVYWIYLKRRKKREALNLLRRLVKDYPTVPITYNSLREYYGAYGSIPVNLIEDYMRANLSSVDCEKLIWLADRLKEKGENEEALNYYEKARKGGKCEKTALLRMSELLVSLNKKDEALVLLEEISDYGDSLGIIGLLRRMSLLYNLGRVGEEDSLFRAWSGRLQGEKLVKLLLKHGELLYYGGQFDSAKVYLKSAYELTKDESVRDYIEKLGGF